MLFSTGYTGQIGFSASPRNCRLKLFSTRPPRLRDLAGPRKQSLRFTTAFTEAFPTTMGGRDLRQFSLLASERYRRRVQTCADAKRVFQTRSHRPHDDSRQKNSHPLALGGRGFFHCPRSNPSSRNSLKTWPPAALLALSRWLRLPEERRHTDRGICPSAAEKSAPSPRLGGRNSQTRESRHLRCSRSASDVWPGEDAVHLTGAISAKDLPYLYRAAPS